MYLGIVATIEFSDQIGGDKGVGEISTEVPVRGLYIIR